jgi:AraC-like DNA-binding protein
MAAASSRDLPTVNPRLWGQAVRDAFFPLALEAAPDRPFQADAQFVARPALRVARIDASRHVARVDRREAQALDGRFIKVVWQLEDSACLHQQGRTVALRAGEWAVYDTSLPYELDEGDAASLVVLLCEAGGAADWPRLAQAMAGRTLPIDGLARIALGAVQSAVAEGPALSDEGAGLLQFCARSFLSLALQRHEGDRGRSARRDDRLAAIFERACSLVQQHLHDPGLGPDRLADELHVSRRTLFNAFAVAGETPQAYLLRRRLERCRDQLASSAAARTSITQVAFDAGFVDLAHFSRAFRRRFGVTPSQARPAAR